MKPEGTLRFGPVAFDALCSRIQETGGGVVSEFDAGSAAMAVDICREAARVLGIPSEKYLVRFENGEAILWVSSKDDS